MTKREIVCDAFDSTIDGIAKRCKIDGNKKAAVEIAAEVFGLANSIVASISDDGRMDDSEKASVKAKFRETIAERVPDESFWFLGTVWTIVKKWLKNVQDKMAARIKKEA